MPSLRVDYVKDIKGLADYLRKRFESGEHSSFHFRVSEDESCLTIAMDGCIKNGRKHRKAINILSEILAEYILKSYENSIVEKIINRVCQSLPKTGRDEIYRIACSRLYSEPLGKGDAIEARKRLIVPKIKEYLESSEVLTLDGFVTFRLGEYVRKLENEVDQSIRQYFIERQYEEYISLLTTFVRMQAPKVPELHVFVLDNGCYKVQGKSPFDIPKDVTDGFGINEGEPIIENDDFMIGFLLTCAPVKIFIHNASLFRNKELLNTIRIVFSECVLIN